MKDPRTRVVALVATAILAHGCSVLAPVPDRSRFFTLPVPPDIATAEGAPEAPRGLVYGLGPVTLPSYLDRREVATRLSETEIAYSPNDRWAAPLASNVASVLQHDLSNLLETNAVVPYPWPATVGVSYQIEVNVLRFERDVAGTSHLVARWSIEDPQTRREVVVRDTAITRAGAPGDTQVTAAGLSETLGALSHEIAAALRALPAPRPERAARPGNR